MADLNKPAIKLNENSDWNFSQKIIFKNKIITTIWVMIKMSLSITKVNKKTYSSNLSDDEKAQIIMSKQW